MNKDGVTTILKHIKRFAKRNTFEYFVHKDLGGFLRRELDFFIKNECIQLDELLSGKEAASTTLQFGTVVKNIGEEIIDFLAQIEDFQKHLFEKKKFVVRTDYFVTIDRVPEELWIEVLKNNEQKEEWNKLYAVEEILGKKLKILTGYS